MAKPRRGKPLHTDEAGHGSSDTVFDTGLFGTPQNTERRGEHDPDSFAQFNDDVSSDPELAELFSSGDVELDALFPSDSLSRAEDRETDALNAILGAPSPDETQQDGRRIVTSDELLEGEEEEDDTPPQDPLGEEFEALFASPPKAPKPARQRAPDPAPPKAETLEPQAPPDPPRTAKTPARRNAQPAPSDRPKPRRDELDRAIAPTTQPRRRKLRGLLIWVLILGVLTYVAFLPYEFDVGGAFTIESGKLSQVRARTDGEIIRVDVDQGDWVEKEQVMAVLSNWDEKREIALRKAEIARREADLQTLLDGARPEEIALKKQELASAELKVQFAQSVFDRMKALFKADAVPQKTLDERRDALRLAESERDEAKLTVDLITSGARDSEIASAKAEIERHEEELDYAELRLEQTFIRAVTDGQIVSDLSKVPVGAFLPEGGFFAQLEDNRSLFAQIDVPETDIEEVRKGAPVEFRLWSASESKLTGTVYRVAPKAEEREFGKVIRVTVEIPNENGHLSSGMTGYAKVAADERPVWQAFSRMIVRFFQIELWSWLP